MLKDGFLFDSSELHELKLLPSDVWEDHKELLFASPSLIWKEGKLIDPFDKAEKLHPPIPNEWIIKYNLEYWNPSLLDSDLKGDGFTILENYLTNTDPLDTHIHAHSYIKLRLKKYIVSKFRIKFSGTPDNGNTFALNIIAVPFEQTQFLKLGELLWIHDMPYVLKDYRRKTFFNKEGLEKDNSEITLESKKQKIIISLDQEIDFPIFSAVFQFFEQKIEVKKGEIFTIKKFHFDQYKLLEVNETTACIENTATGEQHLISQ